MMEKNQHRLYDIAFLLLLPLAVLFTMSWYQGLLLGDDYLGAANQLLHGHWDIEHNYWANRVGTYLPYAVGMWLFGVGTWLNYITTAEFILLLVMVYVVLRKIEASTAFIVACLLAFSTVLHVNAAIVMGDVAATLTANAVVLAYFYYLFYVQKNSAAAKKWSVSIALLVVISFWVKETIVFYFPVLALLYWRERKQVGAKIFGQYFIAVAVFFGLSILLLYWLKTGNPFFRIHAMEAGPSASESNYATANRLTILHRITWQPFELLVEEYSFGCLLLLSVLQLILPSEKNKAIEQFFKIYLIGTLGMWWIGSQGIGTYNPIALVHRLWLPLLVPMAINSTFFIQRIMGGEVLSSKDKSKIAFVIILFLCLAWGALYVSYRNFSSLEVVALPNFLSIAIWYLILCVSILLGIYTDVILSVIPSVRTLLFCIVVFPFVSGGFLHLQTWMDKKNKGLKNGYETEKEMVQYALSLHPSLLITDYRVVQFYYVYTLDMHTKYPLINYNQVVLDSIKVGNYLLLNPERQTWFEKNIPVTFTYTKEHYKVAEFVKNPEQHGFVLIKENETDRLYKFQGR